MREDYNILVRYDLRLQDLYKLGFVMPTFKAEGIIENDTTLRLYKSIQSDGKEFSENDIFHFRKFSPKPDSTNNFIK